MYEAFLNPRPLLICTPASPTFSSPRFVCATSTPQPVAASYNVCVGGDPIRTARSRTSTVSCSRDARVPSPHPAALEAMENVYRISNAAPSAGACAHFLALRAAIVLEESRLVLAKFFNLVPSKGTRVSVRAEGPDSLGQQHTPVAFCSNLDHAWVAVARALRPRHVVLSTFMGDLAARAFADAGAKISPLPCLGLDTVVPLLEEETDAIVLPLVCQLTGEVNYLAVIDVVQFVQGSGSNTKIILDISTAVGRYPIDVGALGVDFIVGDGAGARAPSQIAFLAGQKAAMETLAPPFGGEDVYWEVTLPHFSGSGDVREGARMTSTYSRQPGPHARKRLKSKAALRRERQKKAERRPLLLDKNSWAPIPSRLESGMPSLASIAALAAAVKEISAEDGALRPAISDQDARLGSMLASRLSSIDGVNVLSNAKNVSEQGSSEHSSAYCEEGKRRTGIVSFTVDGALSSAVIEKVAGVLSRHGVIYEVTRRDCEGYSPKTLEGVMLLRVELFPTIHCENDVALIADLVRNSVDAAKED